MERDAADHRRQPLHHEPGRAGQLPAQSALGRQIASASSATNSAYYFSHATREAARVLFNHGLWPAALEIWRQGPYGGQANPYVVRREDANWVDGN
jgi:CO/xanthine dehydrogenase Mo-binding subunit